MYCDAYMLIWDIRPRRPWSGSSRRQAHLRWPLRELDDDATHYHVASYLPDRSEMTIIRTLVNGWHTFFGPPDELLLDAEGAFKGLRFEVLQAQCGIQVRCVPSDAHWQLGRAERHGQALRYVTSRLVSQFAAVTVAELNLCVAMATHAKNTLVRKAGSSPAQWVFGRNPKLPASLMSDGGNIEPCQLTSDSERLQHIEAVRTRAMIEHHRFEANQGLRTALLRKVRPYRGPFEVGQKVAYYRARNALDGEGTVEGYRQGVVLALDSSSSGNIWLRNSRGRVVQAAREQCLPIRGENDWWSPDQLDLDLLKNNDQDLSVQHAPAFRAPPVVPPPAGDRAILRHLEEAQDAGALQQLQQRDPPAAPLPPLDAEGQPVEGPVPMIHPVLVVPPTPRSAPLTPRRPRSKSPVPRTLASVPEATPLDGLAPLPGLPTATAAASGTTGRTSDSPHASDLCRASDSSDASNPRRASDSANASISAGA